MPCPHASCTASTGHSLASALTHALEILAAMQALHQIGLELRKETMYTSVVASSWEMMSDSGLCANHSRRRPSGTLRPSTRRWASATRARAASCSRTPSRCALHQPQQGQGFMQTHRMPQSAGGGTILWCRAPVASDWWQVRSEKYMACWGSRQQGTCDWARSCGG